MPDRPTPAQEEQPQADRFRQQAQRRQTGLLRELLHFMRHHKKWWLAPIILMLLLMGLLVVLGETALPIYPT